MEIAIFFVFIGVCAVALVWASKKTRTEAELARQHRESRNEERSNKLVAPLDDLMVNKDQVWQTRRHHATAGVNHTNDIVTGSEDSGEPDDDGFSRPDKNHVRKRTDRVEQDNPEEVFTMTAVEFETDENEVPDKAAG